MAEGKKTFIFYSDWINMVREMPNKDAGELLKHILSYVNDENPNTDNLLVKMAFGHMKPMLKKDLEKWDNIREIRKKAGSKGGKANAKQKEANAKQVEAVNDNVNVNVNVNDNINEKIKKSFSEIYPTFEDFWDEYDKKVGNRKKIEKKWRSIKQDEKQKIMEYIPNYKIAQPEKRFRKNPETFLNNESWNDELILPIEISKEQQRFQRMQKDLKGW